MPDARRLFWFKIPTNYRTDPAMRTMPERAQLAYVFLQCMKADGSLTEIVDGYQACTTEQDRAVLDSTIAYALGVPLEELAAVKAALDSRRITNEYWDIPEFEESQHMMVTPAAVRMKRMRERNTTQEQSNDGVTVTPCYTDVTPDIDIEKENSTPPRAPACEDAVLLEESTPESPYDSADNLAYIDRQIVKPLGKAIYGGGSSLAVMFPDEDMQELVTAYWRKALAGEFYRIRNRRLNHLTIFAQMQAWAKAGVTNEDLRRHIHTHLDRIAAHDYPDRPEKYVTALIGYELKNGKRADKPTGKHFTPAISGSIPEQTYTYPEPPAELIHEWQAGLTKLRERFAKRGGMIAPELRLAPIKELTPISRNRDRILRIGALTRNDAKNARETYQDDLSAVFGAVAIEP